MIPEIATDANVKPLLAQMLPYYVMAASAQFPHAQVPRPRVGWREVFPQVVLEAMAKDCRTWVLKQSENDFLIGYKSGVSRTGTQMVHCQQS